MTEAPFCAAAMAAYMPAPPAPTTRTSVAKCAIINAATVIDPVRRCRNQREEEIQPQRAQRGRAATEIRNISRKDAKAAKVGR
jgi:hypothetical protein